MTRADVGTGRRVEPRGLRPSKGTGTVRAEGQGSQGSGNAGTPELGEGHPRPAPFLPQVETKVEAGMGMATGRMRRRATGEDPGLASGDPGCSKAARGGEVGGRASVGGWLALKDEGDRGGLRAAAKAPLDGRGQR